MTAKNPEVGTVRRQPMSNTKLLMLIAIGIFVTMYAAAMIFLGKRFLTLQEIFNLLNNNAYLIILGCSLTIVMIGGGIDISVGGVVCLTAMSVAKFLQFSGVEGTAGVILSILLALGMFMLSPTIISLPFKLLIFIAVDGWSLIVQGLVQSYN